MGLQELLKNPFCHIDCCNEDECWITQYENGPCAFAACIFHTFFFVTLEKTALCFVSLRRKDYHVFSFTAIRALFVIMQMRKHAGNLIRAQIWFHVKDRWRGGGLIAEYRATKLCSVFVFTVGLHSDTPRLYGLKVRLGLEAWSYQHRRRFDYPLFSPEMLNGNCS